jgi:hypothetical protein
LQFTVNPDTDLQVIMVPAGIFSGGYQEYSWYCATVPAAQRLQAYLKAKLGLICTIGYAYAYGPPVVVESQQSPYQVPYFTFALNPDGSTPGPVGNSNIANVGGLLLEYFMFPTNADANMLGFFKTN